MGTYFIVLLACIVRFG